MSTQPQPFRLMLDFNYSAINARLKNCQICTVYSALSSKHVGLCWC